MSPGRTFATTHLLQSANHRITGGVVAGEGSEDAWAYLLSEAADQVLRARKTGVAWELDTSFQLTNVETPAGHAAPSPDQRTLYVAGLSPAGTQPAIYAVDLGSTPPTKTLFELGSDTAGRGGRGVVVSARFGDTFYVGIGSGRVLRVRLAATATVLKELSTVQGSFYSLRDLVLSPDGELFALLSHDRGWARILRIR